MSGAFTVGLGVAIGAGIIDTLPILIKPQRAIYGAGPVIYPSCVIEEIGKDDLVITDHPVETGSTVSDHAFKKPREVTLRWSWSNSGISETYVQEVYLSLLTLQGTRLPFTVVTGKSTYNNMLLLSLAQTTNSAQETTLAVTAICREIIMVSTMNVSITPQSALSNPSGNASVQNTGANQVTSQQTDFGGPITSGTAFA